MLCSVCTCPHRTKTQQVTPFRGVWQRQGRTAACTERESYELECGNAAGCASDTDVQGTLDTEHSISLAWGKLVAVHLLYIPFCSYILPSICYSDRQAKKCGCATGATVLQNQRTRKENLKKMPNYISTWTSALIRSRNNPYFSPSTAFKHSKHKLPICCLKIPGIKFILWFEALSFDWGGGNQDKALDHAAQNMTTDTPKIQAGCLKQLKECLLFHDS